MSPPKSLQPLVPRPLPSFAAANLLASQQLAAPKWRRASRPKVRTGCQTCKIRRVKCDETKPTCQRCQKARIACDGYGMDSRPRPVPFSKSERTMWDVASAYTPSPSLVARRFNADEVSYFDFFRHEFANDLSGYCCSEFWTRIVLCEAMTDDCVYHAVLGISALSRGISESQASAAAKDTPSALFPWTARSIVNDDHRVSLRYYVRALSEFRKKVTAGAELQSPRAIFIMTMLLITFELMQGNMKTADGLMTTSINLLKASLSQYRRDALEADNKARAPTDDDFKEIEHMLPFLSIMGGYTPFLKSQTNNLVVWETFLGENVPDLGYRNANQIQAGWAKFLCRAFAFGAQALARAMQDRPSTVDPALLREQQVYLAHLEKWRDVLEIGLARATVSQNERDKRCIELMQLHHQMISINMKCILDCTDMKWDEYDDEFKVLVERCLAFATRTKPSYRSRFTLHMGLLSTLGPAIAKCRNHDIRMRALAIARRMPWREGAWDAEAELFGKLGAVLLEERGRGPDGVVSAENRWSWVSGEWDLESSILVGQYIRSVPDENGQPVMTQLELGLEAWPDVCGDISCNVDHASGCSALGPAR